jgi:serine/threonine-protein kinase
VIYGILNEDPPSLTEVGFAVPPAGQEIIARCLAKNAPERFPAARDLVQALEALLKTEAPPAIPPGSVSPAPKAKPSIAVFPFVNMSGLKEDEYLCEGLAEEIISALTCIQGLTVISRTSSFVVARMGLDVREAGARLNVSNVLEGSVRRSGNRVRVTVKLVSAGDGSQIWSQRYDRDFTDVLVLEDEIATAIAARLRVEFTGHGRERERQTVNEAAYCAYLEGRYHFARGTPDALAKAGDCYARAIASDPELAIAYDALAELHWYLGFFGGVPPREAYSVSTWHALRAMELDDSLAETHALLAMLRKELDYNWSEVERELRRALELNPQSPIVRLRYVISSPLPHGRLDEAIAEMDALVRIDPLSLFTRWWLGVMTSLAHRFDRTIEEGRHMIEIDPNQFMGHWVLGMGLDGIGASAEALVELRRAHELSGGIPFTLGFLAYISGRAGQHETVREIVERARSAWESGYFPPSTLAFGYAGLEQWDAVFEWLERSVDVRDPLIMPIKSYHFLIPVHDDPRFRALLKRMNLQPGDQA